MLTGGQPNPGYERHLPEVSPCSSRSLQPMLAASRRHTAAPSGEETKPKASTSEHPASPQEFLHHLLLGVVGWDKMDQSPPLVVISQDYVTGNAPALGTDRNKFVKVLINISLSPLFLKLVDLFPIGESGKMASRALICFQFFCNLEDFICHKTIFFIYLKLVLSYTGEP